jgi:iron-sulfur cluster repair protein YtfE (RIC family)
MNALTLLRNDHRRVDRLFVEHKQAVGNSRRQKALFDEVHRELDVHAQIEEQVFYPAMESGFIEPVREQMEEARAEHEEVKALLKQLAGLAPEDAGYAVAFTKLAEGVRHHVAEEEGEMFPVAREVLGVARLAELGREMAELKRQLGSGIGAALTSAVKAAKRVVRGPARKPARAKAVARRSTHPRLNAQPDDARHRPGTPRRSGGGLPRSSGRRRG